MTTRLFAAVAIAIVVPFPAEAEARNSAADGVTFYATVYSANSWKEHQFEEIGIYSFSTDSYSPQLVKQDPYLDASGGGVMTDDFYFCTSELDFGSWVSVTHYAFDPDTWEERLRLTDGLHEAVATDMTYDHTTAKVYGCFNADEGENGYVFGTLDIGTGERFKIADIETPWIACSADKNGQLYAIDMSGELLKVDKIYGTTVSLGNLGFEATNRSTGAIDPKSGIFYVVVTTSRQNDDPYAEYALNFSDLYAVDLTDATATHLYEFGDGEVLGGMFIPGPMAEDNAPAAPDDVVINFPMGALTGTVEFTIPATTFGGAAASGNVSYLVRGNGALLAEGTAAVGTKVSAPASIQEAGMYDIELTLSNTAGKSPKVKQRLWLGPDTPKNITNVVLSYSNGKFTLNWNAPTESEHGGYFDPQKISYTILRHPDEVTTDALTSTTFEESITMPDGLIVYSYDITMVYDDTRMMSVTSNVWRLGSMPLPYSADFSAENSMDLFTTIDANEDRCEWYREEYWWIEATNEEIAVAAYPNTFRQADDWLITPPIRLEAGKSYTLSYDVMVMDSDYPERLEISYGTAPTVAGLTTKLSEAQELTNTTPETFTVAIRPEKTDIYYIGFHACSKPDMYGLGISRLTIGELTAKKDVRISSVDTAESIPTNTETTITVTIENLASETAENVEIILCRNDAEISRRVIAGIPSGSEEQLTFTDILTPFDAETFCYTAHAVLAGDENESNNSMESGMSALRFSSFNAVEDLSGEALSTGIALSWSEPTNAGMHDAPQPKSSAVTDSFEDYEPWNIEHAGDWRFVSLDGAPANEMELAPGMAHLGTGEDLAFMVIDQNGLDDSFTPYSGEKCLMAVWNDDYNDDWAISPELSGEAQTVSFYGKSYDDYYRENITVKYSTTDNDINSFNDYADSWDEISSEWTEYSFDLPEGAKYFAIGYVSECKVAFLLDDVTYMPAENTPQTNVIGYNIYRNCIKINEEAVTETSFVDNEGMIEHTYHVTVLYTDGESRLSNPLKLSQSGIGQTASGNEISVYAANGEIVIECTAGETAFAIADTTGRHIATGITSDGIRRIPVATGIYLVKADNRTAKIAVK